MSTKIMPHIWFHVNALQVAMFYAEVFKDSKILRKSEMKDPFGGDVCLVTMQLAGMEVMLMSANSDFSLNDSFSLVVSCHTQEEIDYYWQALTSDGGKEVMCGWLKDKFGLSWQIVPDSMDEMMQDTDKERFERVAKVVYSSVKFNIAELQKAYHGE